MADAVRYAPKARRTYVHSVNFGEWGIFVLIIKGERI
jgi:hypothetical protein